MRKLKVSLREPVSGWELLDISYMYEDTEGLNVVFHGYRSHNIEVGTNLSFRRVVYKEDGSVDEISDSVVVLAVSEHEDDGGEMHDSIIVTVPETRVLTLASDPGVEYTFWDYDESTEEYVSADTQSYQASMYVQYPENGTPDVSFGDIYPHVWTSAETTNGAVFQSFQHRWEFDLEYYVSVSGVPDGYDGYCESCFPSNPEDFVNDETVEFYVLNFSGEHGVFPQDLCCLSNCGLTFDLSVSTYDGNYIGKLYGVSVPYETEPYEIDIESSYMSEFVDGTCGLVDENGVDERLRVNHYMYSRPMFSRTKLIVMSGETSYVASSITDTQATYNRRMLDFLVASGYYFTPKFNPYYGYAMTDDGRKECFLWNDCWWDNLVSRDPVVGIRDVWGRDGESFAGLYRDNAYWRIPVGLASDDDYDGMYGDESVGEYVERVESSLVPEAVDMEKVKYTPIVMDGSELVDITSITFNFHFRKRAEVEHSIGDTTYPNYDDGWYIDPVSGATQWWNGMPYYGSVFNSAAMTSFVEQKGSDSDMLGCLGFTDDDVFFRKQRLSKTFVRLSYYTSNEAVSQKLAGYSTRFMDANSMYGKYLKQYQLREDKHRTSTPLVFFDDNSMSARLDTHITLTGEQDRTKSSEGFNIYIYKEDADSGDIEDLWMKVEFNHAGYGKTIPLIQWPVSGSTYIPLTSSNFLQSLYIPVRLHRLYNRYVYEYPTAEYDGHGGLVFNLFEPKLDIELYNDTVYPENNYDVNGNIDLMVNTQEDANNPQVY